MFHVYVCRVVCVRNVILMNTAEFSLVVANHFICG